MDLYWRPGVNHRLRGALSRLCPLGNVSGAGVDDPFPDNSSNIPGNYLQRPHAVSVILVAEEVDTPAGTISAVVASITFSTSPLTTSGSR